MWIVNRMCSIHFFFLQIPYFFSRSHEILYMTLGYRLTKEMQESGKHMWETLWQNLSLKTSFYSTESFQPCGWILLGVCFFLSSPILFTIGRVYIAFSKLFTFFSCVRSHVFTECSLCEIGYAEYTSEIIIIIWHKDNEIEEDLFVFLVLKCDGFTL